MGIARFVLEELVDPDDSPPNIDRIIASASCVGDAVVGEAFSSEGVAV
jgi:hypothetical protein